MLFIGETVHGVVAPETEGPEVVESTPGPWSAEREQSRVLSVRQSLPTGKLLGSPPGAPPSDGPADALRIDRRKSRVVSRRRVGVIVSRGARCRATSGREGGVSESWR